MAARKSSSSEEFWKKSGSGEGLFCAASSFVSGKLSAVCSLGTTSSGTASLSLCVSCGAGSLTALGASSLSSSHGGTSSSCCSSCCSSSSSCCWARTAALGSGSRGTSSSAGASRGSGTHAVSLGALSVCSASAGAGSCSGSGTAVLAASAGGCGVGNVGVRLAKKSVSPSSWKSNMGAAGAL